MTNGTRRESGFALILAILALVLLATLGLTLATQTSTELQIATNYRWSQQALYNAELGLELAKNQLIKVPLVSVLPYPRVTVPLPEPDVTAQFARNGQSGEPSRNFENEDCDTIGNMGFGAVLDMSSLAYPLQNKNTVEIGGNQYNVPGTFTVWIRRPLKYDATQAGMIDDDMMIQAILTVEGTAPYRQAGSRITQTRRAVRYLEAGVVTGTSCSRGNQESGTATGAGAETCTWTNTGVNLAPGSN
jgi:hypothetical protein